MPRLDFRVATADRWREFRADRGHVPCRILQALSGEMNAVRPDYARVAGAMPFVEGTLAYEIYRELEP